MFFPKKINSAENSTQTHASLFKDFITPRQKLQHLEYFLLSIMSMPSVSYWLHKLSDSFPTGWTVRNWTNFKGREVDHGDSYFSNYIFPKHRVPCTVNSFSLLCQFSMHWCHLFNVNTTTFFSYLSRIRNKLFSQERQCCQVRHHSWTARQVNWSGLQKLAVGW